MLFDDFVWQLRYSDFVINVKTFFEKIYLIDIIIMNWKSYSIFK